MSQEMKQWKKFRRQSLKNKYIFLPFFGKKKMILKYYKKKKGYTFDIDNPVTFNEKLQKRRLEINPKFTLCADKYKVREYVKSKIGEEYLVPLYFAKKKITEEDIKELPESFVLKTNNGSGTNTIVFNKEEVDIKYIVKKMNYLSKIKYGYIWLELFYNNIEPIIIAEKLLLDKNGNIPMDYKFHCFNNKNGTKIYIEVDFDRFSGHKRNMYDENWNRLPFSLSYISSDIDIPKPKRLKDMIEIAKKLSEDFNYVRVDLYLLEEKIFFGELTFTHEAGYAYFDPVEYDKQWGDLIEL